MSGNVRFCTVPQAKAGAKTHVFSRSARCEVYKMSEKGTLFYFDAGTMQQDAALQVVDVAKTLQILAKISGFIRFCQLAYQFAF